MNGQVLAFPPNFPAFPPNVRPDDRLVMNISGYFDESGTHKGSKAVAVAGFLGKADRWGAFRVEWEDALREFGLDYFHMADFESRIGAYNWPNEVRKERINRLLGIIDKYVLGSVGVVLPLADYDAAFPEDEIPEGPNVQELAPGIWAPGSQEPGEPLPEVSLQPGDARRKSGGPYGLAATVLFNEVARIVQPLFGDPHVAYTLEAGAVGYGQVTKLFHDNYADVNSRRALRLLSLTFVDKRLLPPLQAADLLAYELHKHLPRQLGLEERPTRYTLRVMWETVHSWVRLTPDDLKKWRYVIGRGLIYSEGTWHK